MIVLCKLILLKLTHDYAVLITFYRGLSLISPIKGNIALYIYYHIYHILLLYLIFSHIF